MRIAVIGAGALGLTVAYRLARRGAEVTVIEK
jgi:glycine/D-amino acid oxidase-like deaminating enzyme